MRGRGGGLRVYNLSHSGLSSPNLSGTASRPFKAPLTFSRWANQSSGKSLLRERKIRAAAAGLGYLHPWTESRPPPPHYPRGRRPARGTLGRGLPYPNGPRDFPNPRTRLPAGGEGEPQRLSFKSDRPEALTHLPAAPAFLDQQPPTPAAHAQPCTESWPVAPTLARPHRSLTSRA